jgi:hypothetical protein
MAINIESEDPNDNDNRSEITFAAVVKQKANHSLESNTKRSGSENNGNSLEHGLTNQNQSEVNNNQQIVLEDNTNSECVGVARRVVKRLYLGGAREGATSELVTEYMERKGISPTVIKIFKSKRKGTVAIRVNVNSRDYQRVLQNDFWPENVYARPWVSQAKWQDKKKERASITLRYE